MSLSQISLLKNSRDLSEISLRFIPLCHILYNAPKTLTIFVAELTTALAVSFSLLAIIIVVLAVGLWKYKKTKRERQRSQGTDIYL